MYWNRKHVLVCTANHCNQKGAQQVAGRFRLAMKRAGLDVDVLINTCDSVDLCDIGPNMVVYPDGIIYSGVTVKDLPEIVDSLREDGRPVERLRLWPDRGDEARRRAFYHAATATTGSIPYTVFLTLAGDHGFDEPWVAEQAHRGFIARKEIEGEPIVTVTSKARHRYGIPEPAAADDTPAGA